MISKRATQVDIWAIGCLYAEMLSGDPLFPGIHLDGISEKMPFPLGIAQIGVVDLVDSDTFSTVDPGGGGISAKPNIFILPLFGVF